MFSTLLGGEYIYGLGMGYVYIFSESVLKYLLYCILSIFT